MVLQSPVPIPLAGLRAGAKEIGADKGVNDTYFGSIFTDSEEYPAYIKDLDETQLINELLAAALGACLGLPMPKPYLVLVDADHRFTKGPTLDEKGTQRLAFASSDQSVPSVKQLVRKGAKIPGDSVSKWKQLDDAVFFDEWIANGDRHIGNLLFDGRGRYFLIDHGHSFTGPNWEPQNLYPNHQSINQLINGWLEPYLSKTTKQRVAKSARKTEAGCAGISINDVLSCSRLISIADRKSAGRAQCVLRRAPSACRSNHCRKGR